MIDEIHDHVKMDYLKNEFSILFPNIEYNSNIVIPDELIEYLDGSIPLNHVKIVIPVLITYESAEIKNHKDVTQDFIHAFKKQFEEKFSYINNKQLITPSNVEVFFILLPLNNVDSIKEKLDNIEETYR